MWVRSILLHYAVNYVVLLIMWCGAGRRVRGAGYVCGAWKASRRSGVPAWGLCVHVPGGIPGGLEAKAGIGIIPLLWCWYRTGSARSVVRYICGVVWCDIYVPSARPSSPLGG